MFPDLQDVSEVANQCIPENGHIAIRRCSLESMSARSALNDGQRDKFTSMKFR